MRKIRLLTLLPTLFGGGAERVMMYLLRGLSRERFHLTLAVARKEGPFVHLIPPDVEVIDFSVERNFLCVPRLVRLFGSRRFDLCFSMMAMNLAAVVARTVCGADLPLVLGARNHYSRALPAEATHAAAKAWAIKLLYPNADLIIGVARGVCDDLTANFGVPAERTRAIPNPIELDIIRLAAAAPVPHPWLTPDAGRPVIVNVGKLQIAKGQSDLLRAFRLVRDRIDARLLIVGAGPLEGELRAQADGLGIGADVELVGFQGNPHAFMSRASVFVLSSHWEGFPNVLTEAMACGTAVVSTDCPSGPSEIIESGVNGLLVPVGDPEALASAVLTVLVDDELRQRLIARSRKDVERYRSETIVGSYAGLFEEVLGSQTLRAGPTYRNVLEDRQRAHRSGGETAGVFVPETER
jgi:glycosyltransferase involved in cell wall biosynthesis